MTSLLAEKWSLVLIHRKINHKFQKSNDLLKKNTFLIKN